MLQREKEHRIMIANLNIVKTVEQQSELSKLSYENHSL